MLLVLYIVNHYISIQYEYSRVTHLSEILREAHRREASWLTAGEQIAEGRSLPQVYTATSTNRPDCVMTQTQWITSGFALFICEPLLIFWHTLWLWNRLLCNSVDWTVITCKTPSGRLHEKRGDLSGRDWPRVRWGPDLSQITPSIPGSSSALRFTLSLWVCPHLKPVEGSKGPTLTVSSVTDNCHQSLETWLCGLECTYVV